MTAPEPTKVLSLLANRGGEGLWEFVLLGFLPGTPGAGGGGRLSWTGESGSPVRSMIVGSCALGGGGGTPPHRALRRGGSSHRESRERSLLRLEVVSSGLMGLKGFSRLDI